jgi:Domain of unknown function (DUF4349)
MHPRFSRSQITLAIAFCVLALTACDRAAESPPMRMQVAAAPTAALAAKAELQQQPVDASDASPRRLLAVRHDLQLRTDAGAIEAAHRSAQDACADAGCELLSSQLLRDDDQQPSRASLDARVPPDHAAALLARLTALGTVARHETSSEDKTDEVIDVEARLRNMAAFRDHLRVLMNRNGAKLAEAMEVERELVRVQSELDSLASRRKALASLTGKVRIVLTISAQPAVLEAGTWAPLHDAVIGSGRVLARSLATLISLAAAAMPWLVLVLPFGMAARAWRRRRRGTT